MKRFFLFIGNLTACIVENFSTPAGLWKKQLIAGGVNCSGKIISLRQFDKVSDEIKPYKAQAAQTHYMNADVTLACERCCVTNGYLQRLVWDRSVFLKRDKKCYVFK